jgi:twitching motility protein PilI
MNSLTLAQPLNRSQKAPGEAYLKFHLDQQTSAVFSMQHVQEVMTLPSRRITPMPNMPACTLGLINRRSRVFWVVDLAQMLNLPMLSTTLQQYNLIMIQVGSIPLGLAVRQVEGITWVQPHLIQSPFGNVTASLVPYLQGCLFQQQEIVLVLDAIAIAQSPTLRN